MIANILHMISYDHVWVSFCKWWSLTPKLRWLRRKINSIHFQPVLRDGTITEKIPKAKSGLEVEFIYLMTFVADNIKNNLSWSQIYTKEWSKRWLKGKSGSFWPNLIQWHTEITQIWWTFPKIQLIIEKPDILTIPFKQQWGQSVNNCRNDSNFNFVQHLLGR